MYDKTISFLASALNYLPTNSPSVNVLKSHYMSKCRDAQYDKQVSLKRSDFGPHKLCKKCGNPWTDTEKLRLSPKKPLKKHQARLLTKYAKPGSKLEKFQKRIKKDSNNKLIRICTYCSDKTIVELKPPEVKLNPLGTKEVKTVEKKIKSKTKMLVDKKEKILVQDSNKKKKKKKKDKFAGLKVDVVQKALTTPGVKTQSTQSSDQIKKLSKAFNDNQSKKIKKSLLSLLK